MPNSHSQGWLDELLRSLGSRAPSRVKKKNKVIVSNKRRHEIRYPSVPAVLQSTVSPKYCIHKNGTTLAAATGAALGSYLCALSGH